MGKSDLVDRARNSWVLDRGLEDSGIAGAPGAQPVAGEPRKGLVILLDLDQIAMTETMTAAGANARLGGMRERVARDHGHRPNLADTGSTSGVHDADAEKMLAGVAETEVGAIATLFASAVAHEVSTGSGGGVNLKGVLTKIPDLVAMLAGEIERSQLARGVVGGGWGRDTHVVNLLDRLAVLREAATSPGLFCVRA